MKLFAPLYERALRWAAHRHAPYYLGALSFAESTFFPVPPDVMLAPMTVAQPKRWSRLALLTTLASVIGGLVGYAMGYGALELVLPWLERFGYAETFRHIQTLFEEYGFWIVLIAGFTPIPYKVFTIASGAAGMLLPLFALGSVIGRGGRFFLVAGLIAWGGEAFEARLRRYIEWLGWAIALAAAAAILWLWLGR